MDDQDYRITTLDNPFNPFSDFDAWYTFDNMKGYNTYSVLARMCATSLEQTEEEVSSELDKAIDRLVELNPNGLYIKVNLSKFLSLFGKDKPVDT